jgi:putative acetyltransferase
MPLATILRDPPPKQAVRVAVPKAAEAAELAALINHLAAERSRFFIMPVDPVSGPALVRAHLEAVAQGDSQAVLTARYGGEMVGLITGGRRPHPAQRGVAELGMGVRTDCRGRGIGFALITAFEAWAQRMGCHRLELRVATTNASAFALYRKAGFVVEGLARQAAMLDGEAIDELQMGKLIGADA